MTVLTNHTQIDRLENFMHAVESTRSAACRSLDPFTYPCSSRAQSPSRGRSTAIASTARASQSRRSNTRSVVPICRCPASRPRTRPAAGRERCEVFLDCFVKRNASHAVFSIALFLTNRTAERVGRFRQRKHLRCSRRNLGMAQRLAHHPSPLLLRRDQRQQRERNDCPTRRNVAHNFLKSEIDALRAAYIEEEGMEQEKMSDASAHSRR